MTSDIELLITCCKVQPTVGDIECIRALITEKNKVQQYSLIELAHRHGVYPLVYQSILSHANDLLQADELEQFKQDHLALVMQNMQMSAELLRLLTLLNSIGIDALAFKGPALAQLAFGSVTRRQYGDLDILIRRQDIAKALLVLEADGYITDIDLPRESEKAFYDCVNVIGLNKQNYIEIHWELLSRNYAIDWQEEALWHQNETVDIYDTPVPILAFNTHLLYLCIHGGKHLFELFQWVCDIDRCVRSRDSVNWESVFSDAQQQGTVRMLLLGLYLSHKLLDLPLPEMINRKIQQDKHVHDLGKQIIEMQFSTEEAQAKSYGTFSLLWQMRERTGDKLRFAYRGMFAPKFDDFIFIKLPKPLFFLYPVIRPFRLLVKYLGK